MRTEHPRRIAALYDIHGNLPALEAALNAVRSANADAIVIGGDVIPGPMPAESLDFLLDLELPVHCIHGNGEREILAIIDGIETGTVPPKFRPSMEWVAKQLTPRHIDAIRAWPATRIVEHAALGAVFFCHATPRNDMDIFTSETPEQNLVALFSNLDAQICVCGHTHMQFDRTIGRTRVVNAGSVGMPFGERGAYWLLLDSDVRLQHTKYDAEAAALRVRGTAYPQSDEFASNEVLQPRPAAEMRALFTKVQVAG